MINKKKLQVLVFCIVAGIVIFLLYQIKEKEKIKEKIQTLPNFSFLRLDSTPFQTEILTKRHTVIIYFNSTCEHCHYEAQEIIKYISKLSNVNLVFISEENMQVISTFAEKYELVKYQNVNVLQAPNFSFAKYFGNTPLPSIFIYNGDKQLVKTFKGETQIQAIIKYLP
jgi:thiol-disulfide isomerase/thioredoxin